VPETKLQIHCTGVMHALFATVGILVIKVLMTCLLVGTDYVTLVRTELGNSWLYQLLYFDIAYYLFSFVLPLLLLAVFNTRLVVTYRGVRHPR